MKNKTMIELRKIINKSFEMCLQVEVLFFNNEINDDIWQFFLNMLSTWFPRPWNQLMVRSR
jgi:hypothetical protein